MSISVAVLTLELHFPGTHSLKEKRKILNRIKDRTKHRFNVSLVESDHQDSWQRSELIIAQAGKNTGTLESSLLGVGRFIEDICRGEAGIISHTINFY